MMQPIHQNEQVFVCPSTSSRGFAPDPKLIFRRNRPVLLLLIRPAQIYLWVLTGADGSLVQPFLVNHLSGRNLTSRSALVMETAGFCEIGDKSGFVTERAETLSVIEAAVARSRRNDPYADTMTGATGSNDPAYRATLFVEFKEIRTDHYPDQTASKVTYHFISEDLSRCMATVMRNITNEGSTKAADWSIQSVNQHQQLLNRRPGTSSSRRFCYYGMLPRGFLMKLSVTF